MHNFNTGDVLLDLSDFHTWSHQSRIPALTKRVVAAATHNFFTTNKGVDFSVFDASKTRFKSTVYYQETGMSISGQSLMLNLTANREEVMAYLDGQFKEAFATTRNHMSREADRIKSEIARLNHSLDVLKSGSWPDGYRGGERDIPYIEARKADILKIVNS